MPKVSKQSSEPNTDMPGRAWQKDLDGYLVDIVEVEVDTDLTPLLAGLPNDECPSPHWGYMFKGRTWWLHGDGRKEEFGPGDAFYVAPGHTSGADAGSEFVVFGPTETMNTVQAHMMKRAQELMAH